MNSFYPKFSPLLDIVSKLYMRHVYCKLVIARLNFNEIQNDVLQCFLFHLIGIIFNAVDQMDQKHVTVRSHLVISFFL